MINNNSNQLLHNTYRLSTPSAKQPETSVKDSLKSLLDQSRHLQGGKINNNNKNDKNNNQSSTQKKLNSSYLSITNGNSLPNVQLGLDQIESQSGRLVSKIRKNESSEPLHSLINSLSNQITSKDSINRYLNLFTGNGNTSKAHYLLTGAGIDAEELGKNIDALDLRGTFEPLQPLQNTDLDSDSQPLNIFSIGSASSPSNFLSNFIWTSPSSSPKLNLKSRSRNVYSILVGQNPLKRVEEFSFSLQLAETLSVIIQALMRKDKVQIQQTIDLLVEVLPPLPETGVFDPKLATRPTSLSENLPIKQEDGTSFSVIERHVLHTQDGSDLIPSIPSLTKEIKPDLSSRAVASSSSQLSLSLAKELLNEAATAHRIELLQSTLRQQIIQRFNEFTGPASAPLSD
ncbi:hypothetical protein BY996DRAFT_6408781 [Phakopsora pachyrhizi]|nr:hypothetical protein BY996DRAFT_6408781 [Phakopsora pachyrhizi]